MLLHSWKHKGKHYYRQEKQRYMQHLYSKQGSSQAMFCRLCGIDNGHKRGFAPVDF